VEPVRVLALSDEVDESLRTDQVRQYRPDLIVACGDVPFDVLGRMADVTEAPLLFVPGNHDPDLSGYRVTRRGLVLHAGLPAEPPWPPGTLNLDGRVMVIGGVGVAGLGGSRRYGPGPNQYTERRQAWRVRCRLRRARKRRIDVVLTHAPPAGVGDGDGDDPVHQGFRSYHRLVDRWHPRLFLHGHVRPAPDGVVHDLGPTRVVNVFDHQLLHLERP
jgi:hypothetical protein